MAGQGFLTALLLTLAELVCSDVVVELRKGFKPYRIYEDAAATFGDAIPEDGLVGFVVPADPVDACTPIHPPPGNDVGPGVHWIALIRRSGGSVGNQCTFEQKVKAAMKANYSAAIVYNYKNDDLIQMGGNSDDCIPSVFIGHTDAEKILKFFTFSKGDGKYVLRITHSTPFDINAYLLPFAIVVGICFLIMLGIMVFKCIQDRRRERRHRLPKSSLKKIPTKKFVAGDEEHYETCCICLDDYVPGDKLRILPCDHAYHVKCIDPWLLKNKRVCPQCRKKVFATGEVPPSDSESETEDERAPLLARPRSLPSGTFQMQNENPFRRAARRLAGPGRGGSGSSSSSSSGGESGEEEEAGPARSVLAEVTIEPQQRAATRADSPTFYREVYQTTGHEETEEDSEDDVEVEGGRGDVEVV